MIWGAALLRDSFGLCRRGVDHGLRLRDGRPGVVRRLTGVSGVVARAGGLHNFLLDHLRARRSVAAGFLIENVGELGVSGQTERLLRNGGARGRRAPAVNQLNE